MKRIIEACLEQTLRFESEANCQMYIKGLDRRRVKYKIADKQAQPDNSVILKIKKQYNSYNIGDYLR